MYQSHSYYTVIDSMEGMVCSIICLVQSWMARNEKNVSRAKAEHFQPWLSWLFIYFFSPVHIQSRWRTHCVSWYCALDGWQRNSNYAPLMSRLKWHANAVWIYSYSWISLLQDPRGGESVTPELQCHNRLHGRRCGARLVAQKRSKRGVALQNKGTAL